VLQRANNPTSLTPVLTLLAALMTAASIQPALAEKADRDKPVNIESDRMNADDAKKTAVFEGKVVLTQGTLSIRGDRVTVTQDAQGFQTGTAVGNPASFRQKREDSTEYIEAEAERIEYNGKADRVEFFGRARLRRDCGDDVRGNYISYDARTEFFTVNSTASGTATGRGSPTERVSAVLMPKNPSADPATPCVPARPNPAPARN
jgi:lipopolysaccharide export system protein LptA